MQSVTFINNEYFQLIFKNQDTLRLSNCGVCVYCFKSCKYNDINQWISEKDSTYTALCPHCCVDAVIPINNSNKYDLLKQCLDEWSKSNFKLTSSTVIYANLQKSLKIWREIGFGEKYPKMIKTIHNTDLNIPTIFDGNT